MTIYNEGELSVPKKDQAEFEKICSKYGFTSFNDAVQTIELFFLSHEYYGDISEDLKNMLKELSEKKIYPNGTIVYYGDYEGRYEIKNGVLEELTAEQCVLRDTSDQDLLDEFKRRCEVSDDFIHYMMERLTELLKKSH